MGKSNSQKFLKQRRFWTLLPVIVFPFMTILFWLLGGGSGTQNAIQIKSGLNTHLPDANLKSQSALDKLSFYVMADRDSVKREEQVRMDPNFQDAVPSRERTEPIISEKGSELIRNKIGKLQRQTDETTYHAQTHKKETVENSGEVERLQMMMEQISQKRSDPEIDALNGTLDKLLELQNPTHVKKDVPFAKKDKLFTVTTKGSNADNSFFGKDSESNIGGFLSDTDDNKDFVKGAITAVVHSEQILVNGSVIKLRLLQEVFVNGQPIPAGSFVFGNASLINERMKVFISSIRFQDHLYPVGLSVFDMDGIEGIHIPGSGARESVKQSADQGLQSVGGMSFDPSLKAQAAAAGVNAAKSLLSKRIKQERVTVKSGYKVLLREENDKTN